MRGIIATILVASVLWVTWPASADGCGFLRRLFGRRAAARQQVYVPQQQTYRVQTVQPVRRVIRAVVPQATQDCPGGVCPVPQMQPAAGLWNVEDSVNEFADAIPQV